MERVCIIRAIMLPLQSHHAYYSQPDDKGVKRMFLCRVAVGDCWCSQGYIGTTADSTRSQA